MAKKTKSSAKAERPTTEVVKDMIRLTLDMVGLALKGDTSEQEAALKRLSKLSKELR